MKNKFLTIERLKILDEGFNYLEHYTTPTDEIHHVGPNINTEDVQKTKLLRELGKINLRRTQIINELLEENY